MTSRKRTLSLLLCCAALLPLAGCRREPPPILPQGVQTVSGLLKKSPISLTRRGTHVLIQNDEPHAYLESSTVDLGEFEDRVADVTGTYERNVDPRDLPVIVVTSVRGGEPQGRAYAIPALGISLEVPREWKGTIAGAEAQFTAPDGEEGSGAAIPLLSLFLEGEDDLIGSAPSSENVTDEAVAVGGRSGVRWENTQTGVERVQVDLRPYVSDPKTDVLTFLFTPNEEALNLPDTWELVKEDVLRSVKFTASSSSTFSSASASEGPPPPSVPGDASSSQGSAASLNPLQGAPCGGEAGILCPQGSYCEITDVEANVGRCKSL